MECLLCILSDHPEIKTAVFLFNVSENNQSHNKYFKFNFLSN